MTRVDKPKLICCECRAYKPSLRLLVARVGYADRSRPCCPDCYEGNDAVGRYLRNRFMTTRIPDPIPEWLVKDWGAK